MRPAWSVARPLPVASALCGLLAALVVTATAPSGAAPAAPLAAPGSGQPGAATSTRTGTSSVGTVALPPVAVALDATLVTPQAGDSAGTRAARAAAARAQRAYAAANQAYDAAAAASAAAAARLRTAQAIASAAQAAAARARGDLQSIALTMYENDNPIPVSVQVVLTAHGGGDVVDDLARQQQLQGYQARQTSEALDAQSAADVAAQRLAAAQRAAAQAQAGAADAERGATKLVTDAQHAVAALHIRDLEAAAAAAAQRARVAGNRGATGFDNAAAAAAALQAQALASGAATASTFPDGTTVIGTIALATRALLAKAAGESVRGSRRRPHDETAVMGAAPDLGGSVAYLGATGSGMSRALTRFDGHVSTGNWPSAGVGTKVHGTAPFLPGDGVNVHPTLPGYPQDAHPLRAQVAVDSALQQLGSPYVWDAAGPSTFDCSGLTVWAWAHAGVALEHFTGKQVLQGTRVLPGELLPGDLVLFGADLHHVGMYLGAGYMIDAPDTGDYVKIQLVSDMGDFAVAVRP